MKTDKRLFAGIITVLALLNWTDVGHAAPRAPQPPWPEETIRTFGFDSGYARGPWRNLALNEDNATLLESWSGYALSREASRESFLPSPVIIPASASEKEMNFAPAVGAIRCWFAANWSTASKASGGTGPGHAARLLELVDLNGKKAKTRWSLFFNAAGDTLFLAGETKLGAAVVLQAPVEFTAGDWRMITLCYSETNVVLQLDTETIAKGAGLVAPAAWEEQNLGLVIGSDVYASADSLAEGQFDEVVTKRRWPTKMDWQEMYFKSGKRRSLLGAQGTKQEEQAKVVALKSTGLLPEEYGVTTQSLLEDGGGTMAYSYAEGSLWLEILSVTNGQANLIVHGTEADVAYEILSKEALTNAAWAGEVPIVLGATGQDWTPTTVALGTRTNTLFFWARTLVDTDGGGLPDWWQLKYFGHLGVDPYGDDDNDGWPNLLEYQIGINPIQFDVPPPPKNVIAKLDSSGVNYVVTWDFGGGPVTHYSVNADYQGGVIGSVGPEIYCFTNAIPDDHLPYSALPSGELFSVTAHFTNGLTSTSFAVWPSIDAPVSDTHLVRGGGGQFRLVIESVAPDVQGVRVYGRQINPNSQSIVLTNFDIPITSFSNGVAEISQSQSEQHILDYFCYTRAFTSNGITGSFNNALDTGVYYVPVHHEFADHSMVLKQNLRFLLRAATVTQPFSCYVGNYVSLQISTSLFRSASSPSYEHADYANGDEATHSGQENYVFRNFVFDSSDGVSACYYLGPPDDVYGWAGTGAAYLPDDQARAAINAKYQYPGYTNNPTSTFTLSDGSFIYYRNLFVPSTSDALSELGLIRYSSGQLGLLNGTRNVYGLPITGLQVVSSNEVWTIGPGGISGLLDTNQTTVSFYSTAAPNLQTVDYYFTGWDSLALPGNLSFSNNITTPLLVAGWGQPLRILGWAKQAILNGYPDKFAYLQQYFDRAFKIGSNGVSSAQQTGILSPYGEFFPTEPGRTALVTMPDVETGERGTAIVQVVKLQLDVNHDGIMDPSLTGMDNPSLGKPFEFWVNNDYDRGHSVDCNTLGLNCDYEEDDLGGKEIRKLPAEQRVIDGLYTTNGLPAIPCKRDLEDYARVWIPGLTSLLSALPTNYTVVLRSDYRMRFFRAVESDGGTNYLFDETTAQSQVANSPALFLGETYYDAPLVLNGKPNLGEHFIFCAAETGEDLLRFEVYDANQNYVGGTSAYIRFKDIKNLYERWTVGERPSFPPTNVAQLAVEDVPLTYWWLPPVPFEYPANTDTNNPYILMVHGWNMETWEKDRFAETAFKRLYWQGYQGRFGFFRWPTGNGFDANIVDIATDARNYDNSELTAWRASVGLTNLLTRLNQEYPGNVYLMAHSMGNVVAGEALRKANSQLVNTYVAMQAAIPAHTYDANATVRSLGIQDSGTPNCYANYWTNGAPCYFNNSAGAGTYVNFFNAADYALDSWTLNQNFKPDHGIGGYPGYHYSSSSGFYKIFGAGTNDISYLNFPVNTYEIFAYGDEARCYALGAQTNVGGVFLSSQEINLNVPPYNFGAAHKGHSAQFRSDNMRRALFWNSMLNRMGLK